MGNTARALQPEVLLRAATFRHSRNQSGPTGKKDFAALEAVPETTSTLREVYRDAENLECIGA
jgi:hypothetical protein